MIRLTVAAVLGVADDTGLRAGILDDVASMLSLPDGSPDPRRVLIERRVDSLRETSRDLRAIVARLLDRWDDSEGSS